MGIVATLPSSRSIKMYAQMILLSLTFSRCLGAAVSTHERSAYVVSKDSALKGHGLSSANKQYRRNFVDDKDFFKACEKECDKHVQCIGFVDTGTAESAWNRRCNMKELSEGILQEVYEKFGKVFYQKLRCDTPTGSRCCLKSCQVDFIPWYDNYVLDIFPAMGPIDDLCCNADESEEVDQYDRHLFPGPVCYECVESMCPEIVFGEWITCVACGLVCAMGA